MFRTEYTHSPMTGLTFTVGFSCSQLNKKDRDLSFNLQGAIDGWIEQDTFDECSDSPQLICAGLWLYITDQIKADESWRSRALVCTHVTLQGIDSKHTFLNQE